MTLPGKKLEVLAVVTARGGSMSIPSKNIIPFLGKPLIAWSVESALAADSVTRVITTTDSQAIADAARAAGSEIPFTRPAALAQNDTLDLPVFEHALSWLANSEQYKPDIVVHLRPTTPLRPAGLIDEGVRLLAADPRADSIRAVCKPMNNPFKMWRIGDDGAMRPLVPLEIAEPYNLPRQMLPDAYWQTGTLDAFRPATVLEKRSMTGDRILPLIIDTGLAVDIDDELSLRHAEQVCIRYGMG
jgi:CMP-N-acetylneuraminic acid synthetase